MVCVDLAFQCACGIRCNNNVNGKHLCSAICGSEQLWHPFVMYATDGRSRGQQKTYSSLCVICVDSTNMDKYVLCFSQINVSLCVSFSSQRLSLKMIGPRTITWHFLFHFINDPICRIQPTECLSLSLPLSFQLCDKTYCAAWRLGRSGPVSQCIFYTVLCKSLDTLFVFSTNFVIDVYLINSALTELVQNHRFRFPNFFKTKCLYDQ